jgi:predicted nucleic-acid-binding Zn-ribbon protein
MLHPNYQCPKCDNRDYAVSEFRTAGSYLAKIFDVQGKKFSTVTCSRCKFTEIYAAESSTLGNIFDLFTN